MIKVIVYLPKFEDGSYSGSCYHRISYCIEKLQEKGLVQLFITDKLSEENLKDKDVLFYSYYTNLRTSELSILRTKYNFKIIVDIDDNLELDKKNPSYTFWNHYKIGDFVKKNIITADLVIVTNEALKKKFDGLNDRIEIIPNAINFGHDQFHGYKSPSEKIRIGVIGSLSHLQDYEILRNPLKRILGDKGIMDKCEFMIGGVNTGNIESENAWAKITNSIFQKKARCYEALPPDTYMNLYNNLDLLLIPLEANEFTSMKSDIKILEATCKNILVLASNVEPYKSSDLGFIPINSQKDWYLEIKKIVKTGIIPIFTKNKEIRSYEKVNNLRYEVIKEIVENKEKLDSDKKLYVITYDKEHFVEDGYIQYDNSEVNSIEQKSYLFEYNSIIDILGKDKSEDKELIGIFSYKFPLKTSISYKEVSNFLDSNKGYDLYNFCYPLPEPYLKFTESSHPGFMELFSLICGRLGLRIEEPKEVIYSNQIIATKELYGRFLKDCILPAIELMEGEFKDLAWKDSGYGSGLPKLALKEKTGLDFYSFHTFILERMFSIYLLNNPKIKVKTYYDTKRTN